MIQGDKSPILVFSELNSSNSELLKVSVQQLNLYLLPCPHNLLIFRDDDQTICPHHGSQDSRPLFSSGGDKILIFLKRDRSSDEITSPGSSS